MIDRIMTIGVYGFDAQGFAAALRRSRADVFVDVRARRGVRGAEYAFANAARLEAALAAIGLRYAHAKELAPSEATREAQQELDRAAGSGQRRRTRVSAAFVRAYEAECLRALDAADFIERYVGGARRPVLCCVERDAEACHRSLLAARLGKELGVPIEHIKPPE